MNAFEPLQRALLRRASGDRPSALQAVAAATGAGAGVGVLVYRLLRSGGDDDE